MLKIVDLKGNIDYYKMTLDYVSSKWASKESYMVYKDCLMNSFNKGLPNWYIIVLDAKVVGCCGLITNDFISRMDLYPWLCALYVDEEQRNKGFASMLIKKAVNDCKSMGYKKIYLCTDLDNFYEKFGFEYISIGYHPWGESSKIYCKKV